MINSLSFTNMTQSYKKETFSFQQRLQTSNNTDSLPSTIVKKSDSIKNLEKQNTDITDDKVLSKGLSFLHQWLEKTFGKQIKLFDTESLNKNLNIDSEIPPIKMENPLKINNENADIIIEYSIEEYNSLNLNIHGKIQVDGKYIELDIKSNFEHYFKADYYIENGEKKKKDPIFISYDNNIINLHEKTQLKNNEKDLNVQKIGGGGLLFKDTNNNNQYDESDTIFGLSSGNAFSDLAKLDDNNDNFIDSHDSQFNQLKLYELDTKSTYSLSQKNINKLSTLYGNTNYDLKDLGNNPYLNIKQFSFSLDNKLSANLVFGLDFYD